MWGLGWIKSRTTFTEGNRAPRGLTKFGKVGHCRAFLLSVKSIVWAFSHSEAAYPGVWRLVASSQSPQHHQCPRCVCLLPVMCRRSPLRMLWEARRKSIRHWKEAWSRFTHRSWPMKISTHPRQKFYSQLNVQSLYHLYWQWQMERKLGKETQSTTLTGCIAVLA